MTDGSNDKQLYHTPFEYGLRLSAPALWATAILWLSLTSSPPTVPGILGWDKLLHAGAYGLLAIFLAQFVNYSRPNVLRTFWLTLFTCTAYGGLIEIMQWATQAGRVAEWWDLFADFLGALLGCVVFGQASRLSSLHQGKRGSHSG